MMREGGTVRVKPEKSIERMNREKEQNRIQRAKR